MTMTAAAGDRYRDRDFDYSRVERLRADVARDRARLDEDLRCGRRRAAAADARDLARDRRTLEALERDGRRDSGRGDFRNGFREPR